MVLFEKYFMMKETPFLPLPERRLIDQVQITKNHLLTAVIAGHPISCYLLYYELLS